MNFARYLRHLFYRTPQVTFCSTEKYFTDKIVNKEPSKKRKKMETACKKNNDTHKI